MDLIQTALNRGINVTEASFSCSLEASCWLTISLKCYVDALGPAPQWQARLTAIFPTIKFTVCPKADSLFKIVGAASIVAKVTRDRYVHGWVDPEDVVHGFVSSTDRKPGAHLLEQSYRYQVTRRRGSYKRQRLSIRSEDPSIS